MSDEIDKSIEFKIPKGTIVKIEGIPLQLTKSLYVKDVDGKMILDNTKYIPPIDKHEDL